MSVGIVLVSHSALIAHGLVDLARHRLGAGGHHPGHEIDLHVPTDAVAGSLLIVPGWVAAASFRVARRPDPYIAVEARATIPTPRTGSPTRRPESITIPAQASRQPAEVGSVELDTAEDGAGSRPCACSSR